MRIAVVSPYSTKKIIEELKIRWFSLSARPQFVFTYGGDGTILEAERCYSGVPIVPVQKSKICSRCSVYSAADVGKIVSRIAAGKYRIAEEQKVMAVFRGRKISALNEIQLHLRDPRRALRFSVRSGKKFYKEIIGDGLVAATAYGSNAYYRSMGYAPFRRGIRIGFSNVWPRLPSLEINKSATIKILREPAWLAADNHFLAAMRKGDSVKILPSRQKARFVVLHG